MMTLWGRKNSINVQKVLWCLAELGLEEKRDFTRIDAGLEYGVNKSPEYLKMNPNGLVPVLQDGDLILWESHTIMRYLAKKYDSQVRFSKDAGIQAASEKWMDWKLSTLWPTLRIAFLGLMRTPEPERNYEAIKKSFADADKLLGMIDITLADKPYLSGQSFDLGDMCLALGVNRWISLSNLRPDICPRTDYKNIAKWYQQIQEKTLFQITQQT
jgi:glutathione S-transferase